MKRPQIREPIRSRERRARPIRPHPGALEATNGKRSRQNLEIRTWADTVQAAQGAQQAPRRGCSQVDVARPESGARRSALYSREKCLASTQMQAAREARKAPWHTAAVKAQEKRTLQNARAQSPRQARSGAAREDVEVSHLAAAPAPPLFVGTSSRQAATPRRRPPLLLARALSRSVDNVLEYRTY